MPELKRVSIVGSGSCVPDKVLSNAYFEKIVDTSDEWITTRTGIKERRVVESNVATSDLATTAARRALESAKITPEQLDLIIIGTVTPDNLFPSTACHVQRNIGAINATAFDISAACCGFLYSLGVGYKLVSTGSYKNALVIGADILTKITDYTDRGTCVLFGDGSGAAIVRASEKPGGILGTFLKSNGALWHLLTIPVGGTRSPYDPATAVNGDRCIQMAGPEVYKNAVKAMGEAGVEVLRRTGLTPDDISLLIPHQANIRIIHSTASKLGMPLEKVYINIQEYGNTSSASIPIALNEAIRLGRIKPGDKVLMVAFGGGFTWGAVIVEF